MQFVVSRRMVGTAARLTPCLSKGDKWAVGLCGTHTLIRYYSRQRIEYTRATACLEQA